MISTFHDKVIIRTHIQQNGSPIVSVHTSEQTIRVCGSHYRNTESHKEECIEVIKNWITWIRRGSFST